MQKLTDEQVMLRYKEGVLVAMEELVRRYKNPVYCFAYRLGNTEAEAQDITQEVFLRLHQHRLEYVPSGKFSTWIFSITHNLCVSGLRRKKWFVLWPRHKENPDELMDFESPDPSPKEISEASDLSTAVKRCVQGLPFLQREALVLREYQNLDYAEIAKILHRPHGTIKTLIHRARQNLKEKLLPYVEEYKGGIR
jgi:RNA polymerase sigma-70 factor (ECF subfamily)